MDVSDDMWRERDPFFVTPDSLSTVTGTATGDSNSANTPGDAANYFVAEVTGAPGFDIRCNFSNVNSVRGFHVQCAYEGLTASHRVDIQLYDYDDSAWVTMDSVRTQRTDAPAWHERWCRHR